MKSNTSSNISREGLFIFLLVFCVYLFTVAPAMYWGSSSGSFLYSSIANMFGYIPFGGVAFRANLMSSFFCSLVILTFYVVLKNLLNELGTAKGGDIINRAIALYVVAGFAFSRSFWDISTSAGRYAFEYLFILLIVYILVLLYKSGREGGEKTLPLVCLLGFFSGLSIGVHISLVLYVPAIILSGLVFGGSQIRRKKVIFRFLLFLLVGCSVYIYLPLSSASSPFGIDYGFGSVLDFWHRIRGMAGFSDSNFTLTILSATFKNYLSLYWRHFSFFAICVGLAGFPYRAFKNYRMVLIFVLIGCAEWVLSSGRQQWPSASFPGFILFSICVCFGMRFLVDRLYSLVGDKASSILFSVITSMLILMGLSHVTYSALSTRLEVDKNGYWASRELFSWLMADVEDGSVIFADRSFPEMSYLSTVEGVRPTVSLIRISDAFAHERSNRLPGDRYPLLSAGDIGNVSGVDFLLELFKNNQGRKFYWEPGADIDREVLTWLIPHGFFYRLNVDAGPFNVGMGYVYNANITSIIDRRYSSKGILFNDKNEMKFVLMNLLNQVNYFLERNDYPVARSLLKSAEKLLYEDSMVMNEIGEAYVKTGDYVAAENAFISACRLNQASGSCWKNLGLLYVQQLEFKKARDAYERALKIVPDDTGVLFDLALVAEKLGDLDNAVELFKKITSEYPGSEQVKLAAARMDELK